MMSKECELGVFALSFYLIYKDTQSARSVLSCKKNIYIDTLFIYLNVYNYFWKDVNASLLLLLLFF